MRQALPIDFKPTSAWFAKPECLVPGSKEMAVSGFVFRLYQVGKWGDLAWVCPEQDIYVAAGAPFHAWAGDKLIPGQHRTPVHAARAALLFASQHQETAPQEGV